MTRLVALVLAIVCVSGCTAADMARYQPQWQKDLNAKLISSPQVTTETDEFSQSIAFTGPSLTVDLPDYEGTCTWLIRSWKDKKTEQAQHQLYVHLQYSGSHRAYWAAADDHAQPLKVSDIDSSIAGCYGGSCTISEIRGIELDGPTLSKRAAEGYRIKLSSKSGDSVITTITPEQIRLQLEAIAKADRK